MNSCMICGAPFEPFLSFGMQPVANGFLTPDEFRQERFHELAVGFCESCKMIQLVSFLPPQEMFHGNYPFFSGSSTRMGRHFEAFAKEILHRFEGTRDPFVVELGSNDGIMLRHFAERGIRHLGVEPSANVAAIARQRGVRSIERFFDLDFAKELRDKEGQASAILAANVLCHIPTLHSVFSGIQHLLKPQGVFVFEDPYAADILAKTSYDQIYDEHAFFPCVMSISRLCSDHGLEIVDVSPQDVHGGSLRYTIAHRGAFPVSPAVKATQEREEKAGLTRASTYKEFARRVDQSRRALVDQLRLLKSQGKRVVGYGATAKSTTVTNYCQIGPDLVEYICDTTPLKQGKMNPGTHIPIRPYEEFVRDPPDVALLFAWNHAEEIFEKEKAFRAAGGKFLVYVPEVRLI